MLVCYLDDNGKVPQNRITTIAGFVAPSDGWGARLHEPQLLAQFACDPANNPIVGTLTPFGRGPIQRQVLT
jgi:hypothetical protein